MAWYAGNASRANERQKGYSQRRRSEHPDLVKAIGRRTAGRRRALKLKAFVEDVDPRLVFLNSKGVCGICRGKVAIGEAWEVDHVVPLSRGGTHGYDNVQLAHGRCNRSKSDKFPLGQPSLFQVRAD